MKPDPREIVVITVPVLAEVVGVVLAIAIAALVVAMRSGA